MSIWHSTAMTFQPSLEIVDEGVADMDKSSRSERSDSDPPSKNSTPPPEKSGNT